MHVHYGMDMHVLIDDDYQHRAQQHRPKDHTAMAAAVKQLRAQGLLPRDIGQALGLDAEQVHQFMEENRG
jgi:DNA-binding CsgD family transcriptional regulator